MKKIILIIVGGLVVVFLGQGLEAIIFNPDEIFSGRQGIIPATQNPSPFSLPNIISDATIPEATSPSKWLAERLTEEVALLANYGSPQKAYELSLQLQTDIEPLVYGDDVFFDGSGGLLTLGEERTAQEILNEGSATSEEIAYLQARALQEAGYEVRLVSVPLGDLFIGMRKISFVVFFNEETNAWHALANKSLHNRTLEFDEKGISLMTVPSSVPVEEEMEIPRRFAEVLNPRGIAYITRIHGLRRVSITQEFLGFDTDIQLIEHYKTEIFD